MHLCMIHLKRDKNVCFTRDVINYNLEHRAEMNVFGVFKMYLNLKIKSKFTSVIIKCKKMEIVLSFTGF